MNQTFQALKQSTLSLVLLQDNKITTSQTFQGRYCGFFYLKFKNKIKGTIIVRKLHHISNYNTQGTELAFPASSPTFI